MTDEQFWSKVDRSAGDGACWIWTGNRNPRGYGQIRIGRRVRYAHQHSWETANGREIPAGGVILHQCDNPSCCNPRHLSLGDHQSNRADCVAKGRHARGESHGRAVLSWVWVREIRRLWAAGAATQAEMARRYGVTPRAIRFVVKGQHWQEYTQ